MSQTKKNSLSFVKKMCDNMETHQFMLSYRGEISQEITKALLSMAEKRLDLSGADLNIKKKVFGVMVECLQNITKHSDKQKYVQSSLFMIGKNEDEYLVYSGNVLMTDKVHDLKTKLYRINAMKKEELAEFYKFLMKADHFSNTGGAGLGLIDMARKTGNKLDFDFEPVDENYYYFSLRTKINTSN